MTDLISRFRPYLFAVLALLVVAHELPTAAADDFATLAGALSSPSTLRADEARGLHSDAKVMIRMEMARLTLMSLHPSEDHLRTIRDEVLDSLNDCHFSMERIRQLDQYMPDIGGLAERALPAAPGVYKAAKPLFSDQKSEPMTDAEKNAVGQFLAKGIGEGIKWAVNTSQASAERDQYKSYYSAARSKAVKAIAKACQYKYTGVPTSPTAITVDLNGSWNNTFTGDWLCLRNDANRTLTNCTLIVNLKGTRADTGAPQRNSHMHFIGNWPAGQWLFAPYPARSAAGIASDESADSIESVRIAVYSDQLRSNVDYSYVGEEFDKDVKRYVGQNLAGDGTFGGRWYSYENHLFYNNGFEVQYNGKLSHFPVTYITVEAKDGLRHTSLRWRVSDSTMWSGLGGKKWLSHERFNGWNPDEVDVTFEFRNTEYKYTVVWNLRQNTNVWEFPKE